MSAVVIVDYGVGNLRSVQKAFEKAGAATVVSADPGAIANATALVLPGVGAFADAMNRLKGLDLVDLLREQVLEHCTPLLGICLGMQLLARESSEDGRHEGLGLIPARVERLDVTGHRDWAGRKLTLPHIGWNEVHASPGARLFAGVADGSDFYFAHSYHVVCDEPGMVAATAEHGMTFTCAIEHGAVSATQFHPEKSQQAGAAVIANYIRTFIMSGRPSPRVAHR